MRRGRGARRLLGAALLLAASIDPLCCHAAAVCEAAAAAAELAAGTPPGLLSAIGKVESGRRDPLTGGTQIWPWTVNVRGQGAYFATQAEAIDYVTALLANGIRSIDVGCFQVNLQWHPGAFASLAEAFDPAANARYAAGFLNTLAGEDGDWGGAIGRYHSATEALGTPYRSMVLSAWSGRGLPVLRDAARDPFVVRMSDGARSIHVWYGAVVMPRFASPSLPR